MARLQVIHYFQYFAIFRNPEQRGNDHNIFAQGAVIGGGVCNTINVGSNVGVIAGGEMNQIVQGGQHSAIGGGINNTITGSCSVIAGGDNNTVNGAFSAILGGNNNTDGGLGFVGIFGNGLTAVSADTFHVSCLNAVNTPDIATFPAVGTLSFINVTPAMVAVGFPAGSRIAMIA